MALNYLKKNKEKKYQIDMYIMKPLWYNIYR